jgi:DNA-binding MarR family transcriptional regulator
MMLAMTSKPSDTAITAWARLLKVQAKALDAVEADLKAKGHPPLEWYDVLLELKREENGTLRPLELEKRLLLKQHNVSRLIDRMEKKNLLKRLPFSGDGRGQLVAITDQGQDLLRRMWPAYRASIQEHVGSKLNEPEMAKLSALLQRLL